MLTQPQVILLAGLLLLTAAASLTYIGRRARRGQPLFQRRRRRVRYSRRVMSLLRRCLFLRADAPEFAVLHSLGQSLTESLLRLRREVRRLPPLPGQHEPRVMSLARQIAAEETLSAAAMERMLRAWDAEDVSLAERLALPVCTAVAQCEQLCECLHALLEDADGRKQASRLAAQLTRSHRPMELLTRRPLSLTALASLLSLLRTQRQAVLLETIGQWLAGHGTDAEEIADRCARRQTAITEDLYTAADRFLLLSLMDWPETAESCDPLHKLLLTDPSGVYPRMARSSRQQDRARAELLARWLHIGAESLVKAALELCGSAEEATLERQVGYYLREAGGMQALRKHLALRRGRLRIFLLTHRLLALRSLLWGFSGIGAILFLNGGEPLLLLPVFLIVIGSLPRAALKSVDQPESLPSMEISAVTEELRTLVVLPATLSDASDALRALRFLRTASCALPQAGVDLLLLGEHPPAITRTCARDAAVIAAAAQGTATLCAETDSSHFLYLQRTRDWLPRQHAFGARGGHAGAVETVCRLIAQGECEDLFDFSTFSPSRLHRSYAFVLVLDEGAQPVPGLLEALLGAASHPLNTRCPWVRGMRGWSCFSPEAIGADQPQAHRMRLIRPDVYLEATDGLLLHDGVQDGQIAADVLSGTSVVPGACVRTTPVTGLLRRLQASFRHAYQLLGSLRWLLPWGHIGAHSRNPITPADRFSLREQIRSCILPVCRLLLLFYALLEHHALLLLIALLLPDVMALACRRLQRPVHMLENVVMLPMHAAAVVYAGWQAFLPVVHRKAAPTLREPESWQGLELYVQGAAALVCLIIYAALPPHWLPALLPAALFALYPLLHMYTSREIAPVKVLPADREPALRQIAHATWACFSGPLSPSSGALPPAWHQTIPSVPADHQTTPESAGLYLLAVVSARELGFIDHQEAGDRIAAALDSLSRLPLRHGLPCRAYSLPDLTPMDETIDARGCGLLLVSLMTCAQALRSWLPSLPPALQELPAALDAYADRLDVTRLYDPAAGRFYLSLDRDGQGAGHSLYFSDVTLLLSAAARARGLIPPEHFRSLSRTCTEAGGDVLPLSMDGDLAAYLLPGLFLPLDERTACRVILLHQKHGVNGMWGRSASAEHAFTPDLRYRRRVFGLREIASGEPSSRRVFTPYAAALALPFAPEPALDCLVAMQQTSLWAQHGFYDSIDLSSEHEQVAFTQDACHQALLLCAAAHVLADAPMRRYFAGLPPVEACLPLLSMQDALPLRLPPRPVTPLQGANHPLPAHTADADHIPAHAHLIGSRAASFLSNALGSSRLLAEDIPLTRFTGAAGAIEGMQLYLVSRGRVYRVTDPLLPGKTVYAGGCVHSERLCGSLRASLTVFTDPAAGQILHLLEVTNLSTADCRFDAADLLPADLSASAHTLEPLRPESQRLILRDRASGRMLHHRLSFTAPPVRLCVCSDMTAFLGRGRTLSAPASLEEPMMDLISAAGADCLSFRASFTLGGRAQMQLLFSTGLNGHAAPTWPEIPGLMVIADLHAQAVAEAIPISSPELETASRMVAPIFWQGLPHQGARMPLDPTSVQAMSMAAAPILTLTVPDEAALPRLRESLAIAAWFSLHGQSFTLYILCTAATRVPAEDTLRASLLSEKGTDCRILTDVSSAMIEALFAASALVLLGDGRSLSAQLAALHTPRPSFPRVIPPVPGQLPDLSLTNPGGYGGFDMDSGDYIVRLEAGQTTPIPWPMHLHSGSFAFTADETGTFHPIAEHLMISVNGGAPMEPFRLGLPVMIRTGCGWIRWRVFAKDFILTLDTACLVGHAAALRALRVRNLRKEELSVNLTIAAGLASSSMQHLDSAADMVFATGESGRYLAAAEGAWTADAPAAVSLPVLLPGSRSARLSTDMHMLAGCSAGASWLLGHASTSDDAASAQEAVRSAGASACIRAAREAAGHELPALSISTPEPTLDLLVNHVLPRQVHGKGGSCLISVLVDPSRGRDLLLSRLQQCSDNSIQPALIASMYLKMTGDSSLLDTPVQPDTTLLTLCRDALLARQLDRTAPEKAPEQLCEALLSAAAAGILLAHTEDEGLGEHRRSLLNAADTYLWNTDHHSADEHPLLSIQACAALALGDTPRVRKGLRTCWDTLYDRKHGLIREKLPDGSPSCPGTPDNGGQITLSAVLYLAALVRMHHDDRAWELLRALNPLHHTDDPVRSETYAGAPWLLPAGMHASPSAAGLADGEDARAADLLLTVIVTSMLGLTLQHGRLAMQPCVPADWDSFSITLRIGASTWYISMERDLIRPLHDNLETDLDKVILTDDGRIHQLRLPLT